MPISQGGAAQARGAESDKAPAGQSLEPTRSVPYTVRFDIKGEPAGLRQRLEAVSKLVAERANPPFSAARLRARARDDVDTFVKLLRSEGYYAGTVDFDLTPANGSRQSFDVDVRIDPGPAYDIDSIEILVSDLGDDPRVAEVLNEQQALLGRRAESRLVIGMEKEVVLKLSQIGYPRAAFTGRKAVVNHGNHSFSLTEHLRLGGKVTLGPAVFTGLEKVDRAYLEKFVPWHEGDIYDQRKLDKLRAALYDSGLFQSVSVELPSGYTGGGPAPVIVTVKESKHRSVGAGFTISSSDGFGGNAFWEHRNFFRHGERLRISLDATTLEQVMAARFSKPNFLRQGQKLRFSAEGGRQDVDAYREVYGDIGAGLDRPFGKWRVSVDTQFELTQIEQNLSKQTFKIVSLGLSAFRDTTDDPLDPTKGYRLRLRTTPNFAVGSGTATFLVTEGEASVYQKLITDRLILAARSRVGSIMGASRFSIPASKRFYAGGGRSIRGYNYQKVGPLDANGDPLGGRAVTELNVEARIRATKKFSIIPFFDAGSISENSVPDFSDGLRMGAGLGFAYKTAVGPVRLDLARAIDRRPGIDDVIEFYISLGQAF